jgi:predicted dehydrogenase
VATEILRVGVAGIGNMGMKHLRALAERQDVAIVAVADPDPAALARARKVTPHAHEYHDAVEMLERAHPDAAIAAVPTVAHYPVALAALRWSVPLLLEKPIAATVQQGREIVETADGSKTLLQIGFIERFNPAFVALEQALAKGILGAIFQISTNRVGPRPGRDMGNGVAIDLGTHDLDLICRLVAEHPVSVHGGVMRVNGGDHEDLMRGILTFATVRGTLASGTLASVHVNWLTPTATQRRELEVVGEAGLARANLQEASLAISLHDGTSPDPVIGDKLVALRKEHDSFLDAVRFGHPAAVTPRDGLWALYLARLLLDSAREGHAIAVKDPESHESL